MALKRIEVFLSEEEVDEQVSTIKRTNVGVSTTKTTEFGIKDGTFLWNSVKEDELPKGSKKKTLKNRDGYSSSSDADSASGSTLTTTKEHIFELADISVIFPDGELSVITGPTASGKTALLVRVRILP